MGYACARAQVVRVLLMIASRAGEGAGGGKGEESQGWEDDMHV